MTKTDFTPTDEQLAIVEFARSSDQNLILQALAGAAKTSTLILIAEALKKDLILCLAFNRRIAVEMTERLPGNCQSMTLNSLGHHTWGQALGRRLSLSTGKNYQILRGIIDQIPKTRQEAAWDELSGTLKAVVLGKALGYVPDGSYTHAHSLMGDEQFFALLEREPSSLQEQFIIKVSHESIKQGMEGRIDFSDQLLLPVLFPTQFPKYPIVMIDEAQDLSELNHRMLEKLVRGRLIAVGDPCQAIYSFRGAHETSMQLLEETFFMHPMTLTISFRCPSAIVDEVRWRAPAMRYPSQAKIGSVSTWGEWNAGDVPERAAIICRNNAPLFSMAIKLLKNGRAPQILGNDFTKGIIKKLKSLGASAMLKKELFEAIGAWREREMVKARNPRLIEDQAECFHIFAENADTLGAAIAYAEHILSQAGPIQLMTGHKAKGLEFDDVIFLDQHLVRDDEQDPNLRYVIQTRAKDRLIYALSEDFLDGTRKTEVKQLEARA